MKLLSFNLEKVYFDCIDEEGNCFVIYWANLKLSYIKLVYSGLIFSNSEGLCIEKSSLKKVSKPLVTDLLQFNNPRLKVIGDWRRLDAPISILLYTDKQGKELFWNCHHPKTFTNVVYNNKTFQGLGYAETLSLPIKPWQLPIDELRWGRFLSEHYTIIWIHWKGKNPINKIICNGTIYEDAIFEENRVLFDNGMSVLNFQETTIIRKGKLSNVLSRMPWLKIIFNSRILNTKEIKYKAQTSFSKNLITLDKGWSLFEIVTWMK